MGAAASAHKKRRQVEAEGAKLPKDLRTHSLSSKQQAGLAAFRSNGAAIASAPASEPSNIGHYYCGLPRAPKNESLLGSDPHQAGWLAGKWTASSDDIERTDALRKLGILLTEREEAFDRMTAMAAELFETPICLISFVDEEEQWFKSAVGLDAASTGRDMAFCTYVVLREMPGVFVVLDARADARFAQNPLVTGPPFIQFYAGAPIFHPDTTHKMGSFCVIDTKPWPSFGARQQRLLQKLADMVQHELVSRATRIAHENKARVLLTLSSEMRETQQSLEASIGSFRNLIQAAASPIFAVDASQKLVVTLWNKRMEAATGLPSERAVGRPVVDALNAALEAAPDGDKQRRTIVRSLLRALDAPFSAAPPARFDEGAQAADLDLPPRSGPPAALRIAMTPIFNAAAEVTGVVCVGASRTPAAPAGAAGAAGAAPPPAAAAAAGAGSGALCAELGPPLAAVAGVLELALRDPSIRGTRSAKALQQAATSAQVLYSMVEDAQGAEPASEVFTAHEAADVCLAVSHLGAQQRGVRLLTAMEAAVRGTFLAGDGHRLVRVAVALLDVAIGNAKPDTDLELRLLLGPPPEEGAADAGGAAGATFKPLPGARVALHVAIEAGGAAAEGTASPKGKRLPAARRPKPTQAQRAAALRTCAALVAQMGGRLSAPSSPSGTNFAFYVLVEVAAPEAAASERRAAGAFSHPALPDLMTTEPAARARGGAEGAAGGPAFLVRSVASSGLSGSFGSGQQSLSSGEARGAARGHVLAVDDSGYNLDVAKNMLQMLGNTVATGENGKEASDLLLTLRAHNPCAVQLVLMDCDMPVMDGWEATKAIRAAEAQHGWARVPIVAVTAYASSDTQARCLACGMDDYLSKPYSLASLRQKLALHMTRTAEGIPAEAPPQPEPAAGVSPDDGSGGDSPKSSAGGGAPAEGGAAEAPLSAAAAPPAGSASVPEVALSAELAAAADAAYSAVGGKAVVNAQQMQAIFGGNAQLMSQAVSMYLASSKELPATVQAALASRSYEKLHRTVHQCKGSAGYIGAERVHAVALELQETARALHQQQLDAGGGGAGAVQAPLAVCAQVHALCRCMIELIAELEKAQ